MRKIPAGAEASNILVGEVDFLDKTLSAFIRLSQAGIMGDLTEVPVPTRFIFVLLGPMVRTLSRLRRDWIKREKWIENKLRSRPTSSTISSRLITYLDLQKLLRWKEILSQIWLHFNQHAPYMRKKIFCIS